jgi:hypothetical protein
VFLLEVGALIREDFVFEGFAKTLALSNTTPCSGQFFLLCMAKTTIFHKKSSSKKEKKEN